MKPPRSVASTYILRSHVPMSSEGIDSRIYSHGCCVRSAARMPTTSSHRGKHKLYLHDIVHEIKKSIWESSTLSVFKSIPMRCERIAAHISRVRETVGKENGAWGFTSDRGRARHSTWSDICLAILWTARSCPDALKLWRISQLCDGDKLTTCNKHKLYDTLTGRCIIRSCWRTP